MGDRTQEYKMREFMAVLWPIQARIERKHGKRTIFKWRQARLNRPKEQITPEGF